MPQTVKFWFDPACPFAWITSRWITEVEKVRDINVDFHVISLGVLNEDKQDQDDPGTKAVWQGARVALAVRERHGADKVAEFYTAVGTRVHNEVMAPTATMKRCPKHWKKLVSPMPTKSSMSPPRTLRTTAYVHPQKKLSRWWVTTSEHRSLSSVTTDSSVR